jgi:hypothetical protein
VSCCSSVRLLTTALMQHSTTQKASILSSPDSWQVSYCSAAATIAPAVGFNQAATASVICSNPAARQALGCISPTISYCCSVPVDTSCSTTVPAQLSNMNNTPAITRCNCRPALTNWLPLSPAAREVTWPPPVTFFPGTMCHQKPLSTSVDGSAVQTKSQANQTSNLESAGTCTLMHAPVDTYQATTVPNTYSFSSLSQRWPGMADSALCHPMPQNSKPYAATSVILPSSFPVQLATQPPHKVESLKQVEKEAGCQPNQRKDETIEQEDLLEEEQLLHQGEEELPFCSKKALARGEEQDPLVEACEKEQLRQFDKVFCLWDYRHKKFRHHQQQQQKQQGHQQQQQQKQQGNQQQQQLLLKSAGVVGNSDTDVPDQHGVSQVGALLEEDSCYHNNEEQLMRTVGRQLSPPPPLRSAASCCRRRHRQRPVAGASRETWYRGSRRLKCGKMEGEKIRDSSRKKYDEKGVCLAGSRRLLPLKATKQQPKVLFQTFLCL